MRGSWIAILWSGLMTGLGIGVVGQAYGVGTALPLWLRSAIPEIRSSRQLIVVTTHDWNEAKAAVECFERPEAGSTPWRTFGRSFPAIAGAQGWGWGIGLHGTGEPGAPRKAEGDCRAPAGVFKVYSVFGLAPANRVRFLRFPYRQVTSTTEAIDDPRSKYYNRIVDRTSIAQPDWSSSESMQRVGGRYRFGVMIEHNWEQVPGFGSCIFLHLWVGANQGTSGCTAMSPTDLTRLLHWLDARNNPLVVQLPLPEYQRLQKLWGLPALKSSDAM